MFTLKFHFKTIDESIEFIDSSKPQFEGFEHTITTNKNGKIVIVEIAGLKDKVIWNVRGKTLYMN